MNRTSTFIPVSIAASGTTSSEIISDGFSHGMLKMGAALNGTTIEFDIKTSESDSFEPLVDSAGAAISITFTANSKCRIPDAVFGGYSFRLNVDAQSSGARSMQVFLQG